MKKSLRENSSGYTLVELLIVVSIIGLISLVSVPSFIVMFRSAKMKTSLQNFSADLRGARQAAISKNLRTRVSFDTGLTGTRAYSVWLETKDSTSGVATWTKTVDRNLELPIYFSSTTFTDDDLDGLNDVIFLPNGTIDKYPVAGGSVTLTTDQKITPNVRVFTFKISGQFTVN